MLKASRTIYRKLYMAPVYLLHRFGTECPSKFSTTYNTMHHPTLMMSIGLESDSQYHVCFGSSQLTFYFTQSYGKKGKAIILAVLMKKFPLMIGILCQCISMTVMKFLKFVLIPYVAICLIQQDLKLENMAAAYQTMLDSSEFGN